MPNLANAKKAHKQSLKHQAHNKGYKNRIKNLYQQISDLSRNNKQKEALDMLPSYYKAVDKAAKKNILHKNTAARKKSFVTKIASGSLKLLDKKTQTEEATAAASSSADK